MKKSNKIRNLELNRYSIITNDLEHCYICGGKKEHLHEIIFGKNRVNSMKYGLVIPVCFKCHDYIHNNIKLDNELKVKAQSIFEATYDEDFVKVFHKNYI